MFSRDLFNCFLGALLLIAIIPDATSYNKYGRTCKDIGCRSDETCVMAEDPCTGYTSDKCGRYPTCRKTSDASCTSMVCGQNEYCKSEDGAPKCVRKSTGLALPPGIDQVSHQSTPTETVPAAPPGSSSSGGRSPLSRSSSSGGISPPPRSSSFGAGSPPSRYSSSGGISPSPRSSSSGGRSPPSRSSSSGGISPPPRSSSSGAGSPPFRSSSSGGISPPPRSSSSGAGSPPSRSSSSGGISPPPRSSSSGAGSPPSRSSSSGGRFSDHFGFRNTMSDGSTSNRLFGNNHRFLPTVRSAMPTSYGSNFYNTHTHMDSRGNRVWTFSENDEMKTRTVPKRQTSYPTETETHGSLDTSKNSDSRSYPTRSSSYPSGSGYPGYPSSGVSDSTNQPRSGYPSSGSGYPSSGSSGYPAGGSSGYPAGGSSGYPADGSSGYPAGGSSGYPAGGSSGYPAGGSSGYPAGGSSGYPSSGSSGYPTGSGYPNRNSGSSGYPDNSRNPYGEETVRRTGANTVNVGYPNYPHTSVYPEGNPSYRGNYPAQNTGYPYNNQQPSYPNQGYTNGYPQNYPQGGHPGGYYQGQNYMPTTKRPSFQDQLTNFARNMAEKVLTQTIVDRITGKHQ